MAEILLIPRKTLSNQSINQSKAQNNAELTSTTRRIRSISQCCIILPLTGAPFYLTLWRTVNTDLDFQQVGGRRSPGHVIGLWGSVSGVAMGTGAGGAV